MSNTFHLIHETISVLIKLNYSKNLWCLWMQQ